MQGHLNAWMTHCRSDTYTVRVVTSLLHSTMLAYKTCSHDQACAAMTGNGTKAHSATNLSV